MIKCVPVLKDNDSCEFEMRVFVVGAGFAGAVIAREFAESGSFVVRIIDKRDHVACNAYDPIHPRTGHRYHKYGPHIFHADSAEIVDYLSRFTGWMPYEHKVQAILPNGVAAPMPINLDTLNAHYRIELPDETAMKAFLKDKRLPIDKPGNALEYLHSIYGIELTELFFGRYTKKCGA